MASKTIQNQSQTRLGLNFWNMDLLVCINLLTFYWDESIYDLREIDTYKNIISIVSVLFLATMEYLSLKMKQICC